MTLAATILTATVVLLGPWGLTSVAVAESPSAVSASKDAPTAAPTDVPAWPGFRGPSEPLSEVFPESFGLELAWTRALGSGYSSLAIADGKVIALYTDGEEDVMGAFDTADGKPLWRLVFGEKYAGHDGSDDGPLSTPTIAGDRVYALGPRGHLVAASSSDGKELWRVSLDSSNASIPYYGFTSSPLVVGDRVILLTGGEKGTITAFDASTGERRWAKGDDSVTYQSPTLAVLAGRRQLVAPSDHLVQGLDPENGDLLWTFRHEAEERQGNGSIHATPIGPARILLNLDREAVMLEIGVAGEPSADESTAGSLTAREVWRERVLVRSSVLPVVHGDYLFGFTSRILTAVNAGDGQIAWRSRDVSGSSLALVDGHLLIFSAKGELVVAEASGSAMVEKARLQVFEKGDYADPAYYDGRIYVRNLESLAAVSIAASSAGEPDTLPDVETDSEQENAAEGAE